MKKISLNNKQLYLNGFIKMKEKQANKNDLSEVIFKMIE